MTSSPFRSGALRAFTLGVCFLSSLSAAAEAGRNWTDNKGRTVSAVFLRQDESNVWLKRADGREVAVVKETLSDEDKIYLATRPTEPVAAPSSGAAQAATVAGDFNAVKIDPASFKPVPGGFSLDSLSLAGTLESEHFIVAASDKVKPAVVMAYLDVGERLWADLLRDIPSLGAGFEGRKYLMLLADGEDEAKRYDSWHSKHITTSKRYLNHNDMTKGTFTNFHLETEFAKNHGVAQICRMFRTDTKGADNLKRLWPQRIHFLCEDLLRQAHGGISTYDNDGNSMVVFDLVVSFQREFSICGKIETEVHFGNSASEVEGFKNGRNWVAPTKKLIKNGAKPDIAAFLKTKGADAAPRDVGMGFGLAQWLRKDLKVKPGFDRIFTTAAEARKCLTPEQFATALGFDSPEALNAAWLKYLESDAFQ